MFGTRAIYFAAALVLAAFRPVGAAAPTCSASDIQCITNATPGSTQTSGTRAAVAGTGPGRIFPSKISVNTGSYRINSGAFTSAPGTIANGDKVTLRLDASSSYSAAVTQTLSIEGQPNRIFRVITLETDPNPPPPPPVVVPEPVAIRWSAYGKLTLPVDQDGKAGADEIEASALDNYSSTYWYQPTSGQRAQSGYSATGGETVFWTPVNGDGTTESSSYARTEMREQVVSGNNRINWGLAGTHIQKGTVVVSQIPTAIKSTSKTFLVFGQMHSVDNSPPMKMIFQRLPDGTTEVMSNYNTKRAGGASQNSPVKVPIRIGEKFTYEIRLIDGTITTLVNNIVLDVRDMSSGWNGAQLFFKAGSYLGNNAQTATGYGEVVYSTFEVVHQ
nr:polysaccharide lyase family 7 protein [Nevskia ramosa]